MEVFVWVVQTFILVVAEDHVIAFIRIHPLLNSLNQTVSAPCKYYVIAVLTASSVG